jgi:hypothetical protein
MSCKHHKPNPRIANSFCISQGTKGGGNRFPGVVARPFSFVKLGPDVESGKTDAYSGYLPSGNIWGFSMMHESGTGGAPKYGVVSQMPVVGNISNPVANFSQPRASPDQGSVGYYKSSLANGIVVELTATEHAGLYTYTYPNGSTPSVVVDVSHVLPSFRGLGWEQHYTGGSLSIADDGHYTGFGTYNNGWNLSPDWTIYFCGRFSQKPSRAYTFIAQRNTTVLNNGTSTVSGSEQLGGVFTFANSHLSSRVGVSFISAEKACANLDAEISEDTRRPGGMRTYLTKSRYRQATGPTKNSYTAHFTGCSSFLRTEPGRTQTGVVQNHTTMMFSHSGTHIDATPPSSKSFSPARMKSSSAHSSTSGAMMDLCPMLAPPTSTVACRAVLMPTMFWPMRT